MKRIFFKLDIQGQIEKTNIEPLTQYTFQEDLLQVYVPKELVENQTHTLNVIFTSCDSAGVTTNTMYNVPFVKEQTSEQVDYYLYSRLMPKIATLYRGEQRLSFAINLVSKIDGVEKITSRITSQAYWYRVIESNALGDVEEITEYQDIQQKLNDIIEVIGVFNEDKQDKVDTSISVKVSDTSTKVVNDVATAINTLENKHDTNVQTINKNKTELDTEIAKSNENIDINKNSIANHESRISSLENEVSSYFHFVGTYEYTYKGEPSITELDNFCIKQEGAKHKGDTILAITTYGDQDTLYICIWTNEWSINEINGLQKSDNDNFGVIKGNDRLSIVNGQAYNVYVNTSSGYMSIDTFYQNYIAKINQIESSATSESSRLDNKIDTEVARAKNEETLLHKKDSELENTLETKASFQNLYDYALPRNFNDVYYLNQKTKEITTTLVTSTDMQSYGTGQTLVGDYVLKNGNYYFELTRRNTLMIKMPYFCSTLYSQDTTLKITMNGYYGAKQMCSYTQDLVIRANDSSIHTIEINCTLNSLGDDVISVSPNDEFTFNIFITNTTNDTFILTFINNPSYTSTFQYTCALNPIVTDYFVNVVDETLTFEKQGSVVDEVLIL